MSLFTGAVGLASLLGPVIGGAVGAKVTSNASEHAADTQAKAAQEALDFTKAQKAKQEAAYAPYAAVGQQAASTLSGLVRPAPMGGPPAPYASQPMQGGSPLSMMGQGMMQGPSSPTMQQPAGATAHGAMVMLQAPDGTQKQVPVSQASFYISRGAKQVG